MGVWDGIRRGRGHAEIGRDVGEEGEEEETRDGAEDGVDYEVVGEQGY